MRRYVHLGINPIGAIAKLPASGWPPNFHVTLENYLKTYADYYRYGAQNYVLCTDADLTTLATGIAQLPGFKNIYVFISEISGDFQNRNGWMPAQFWQWLQGKRW